MQHENSQLVEHLNYKPYQKPGNEIVYIHKDLNYTTNILRQIRTLIEKFLPYHSTKPY